MTLPFTISPQAAFVAALVVKATLVLAAAALFTFALSRRAPASARHLVWTLAVCALLALPLFAWALPGWKLPFVVVAGSPAAPSAAPVAGAAVAAYAPAAPVVVVTEGTPTAVYAPVAPVAPVAMAEGTPVGGYAPAAPVAVGTEPSVIAAGVPAPLAPDVARPELAGTGGGWMGFAKILGLVYAAVTLVLLARIGIGRLGVRRLARQAVVVTDSEWTGLVRDLAWQLEIDRPVTLLRSTRATMPMTWGVRRPTILLPAESAEWTTDRIRVVLLHELAHVARHDCLTQTLAAVACALYWFHPGSWHAARRLRVERELACDDRVLAAGTRAREYAAHLLEVARAFRAPPLAGAAAVSMARPSQLEGRLLAVLDGVRDRRTVSRRAAGLGALAAAGLVLPLAAMRPGEARAAVVAAAADGAPSAFAAAAPGQAGGECELRGGTAFNCTVEARSGERLYLELSDRVSVRVRGRDHDGVAIHTGNGRRRMDVSAERVAGGVRVRASVGHGTDAAEPDLIVEVPGRFDVQVAGDGSGVELRDVRGTFSGHTRGGGLAFIRAAGTVRMDAGGGGAYIADSHLDGRLEMGGGGVMMAGNRGDLDVVGAGATVRGNPDQAREWSTRARSDADGSGRSGDVAWRQNRDGSWATSVGGADVSCQGDNCVVYVDTGGAGRSSDVRGAGQTWSRAAAGADARGQGVVAQSWSGTGSGAGARGSGRAGQTWSVTGRAADGRGAPAAIAGSSDRTSARTWATTGEGFGYVAGAASQEPVVISADGGGVAYATGNVNGRIASIDAMARYAPVEAAAQGIARLALQDPDARVQRAAVDALAGLRGSVRDQQLRRIAREHRSPEIRRRAQAALR